MPQSYASGQEPIAGYRLTKFLGRGGFGEVWKAKAPGGTECALKLINLKERQGIKEFRAIRLVKCVSHPHLTPIYALWLKDKYGVMLDETSDDLDSINLRGQDVELVIAMQLGSRNLLDRLEECQEEGKTGIPITELLDHMEDAAKGIDYLNQPPEHEKKAGRPSIQHCDVKPQNILLVGNSAQVCDFGLARPLNDARKTSQAAISFAYVSPELIQDQTSPAVDQYSLAISYYELRAGSLPFSGSSAADVMFSHLQGKLIFAKVPEAEQIVLKRATALKPEDRFPSCLDMAKALRRAIEGRSTSGGSGERNVSAFRFTQTMKAGDEVVPQYRLVRKLGRGGYGEVWEAAAPGGKHVAVKIIHNLDRAGARHEFKALEMIKGLDHNHLMEVHAYWLLNALGEVIPDELRDKPEGAPARTLVIASRLASKNLLQRLQECQQTPTGTGGIPYDELVEYMRQAAGAIDYLNTPQHPLGDRRVAIQHRDIKPENILLAANTVKVSDFGLAKVLEGSSAQIHGDSAGMSLHYAAPEIFNNEVNASSDQYSLALTYIHLRTGILPFAGSTRAETMLSHTEGRVDLSRLPVHERPVLARATALDPEKRYRTCMEMVKALERTDPIRTTPMPPSRSDGMVPDTQPVLSEQDLLNEAPDYRRAPAASGDTGIAARLPTQEAAPVSATDSWADLDSADPVNLYDTVMVPARRPRPTEAPAASPASRETDRPPSARADTDPALKALVMQDQTKTAPSAPEVTAIERVATADWKHKTNKSAPKPSGKRGGVKFVIVGGLAIGLGVGLAVYFHKVPGIEGGGETPKKPPGPNGGNPQPTVDRKVLGQKLAEADGFLKKNDPSQARRRFGEARELIGEEPGLERERMQAILGQAQASAHVPEWGRVQQFLAELKPKEPGALTAEQNATALALGVLADETAGENRTRSRLNRLLPLFQPDNRIPDLKGWEREEVMKTIIQAPDLDKTLKAETGDSARSLANLVLEFDSANAVAKAHAEELGAIQSASVEKLAGLLGNVKARKRPVELVNKYVDLSLKRDKKQQLADAKLLSGAVDQLSVGQLSKEERAQVNVKISLLIKTAAPDVRQRLPYLKAPEDFVECEQICDALIRTGSADPFVWHCWAECMLETGAPVQKAAQAAWSKNAESGAGAYGHYVRAEVLNAQGKTAQAFQEYNPAFANPEDWQNAWRLKKATERYASSAGKASDAELADLFIGFKGAVGRYADAPRHARLALAKTALRINPKDLACAKAETGKLIEKFGLEQLRADAYDVFQIHARAQDMPGEAAVAIADYERILKAWPKPPLDGIPGAQLFAEVVEPAVAAGETWFKEQPEAPKRRERVAWLDSFRGHLIYKLLRDRKLIIPKDRRLDEAVLSYTAAVKHYRKQDDVLAEYLLWQGYLTSLISTNDTRPLRALADRANPAAPGSIAAHFLEGLTCYWEAAAMPDRQKALPVLDKAVDNELSEAIKLSERNASPPELLNVQYERRSWANILRANYLPKGSPKKRGYIEQARDDALRILKLNGITIDISSRGLAARDDAVKILALNPSDRAEAYIALGNSLEDLAWLCDEDSWNPAFDAFGKAMQESQQLEPQPFLSRGRTRFKHYRDGHGPDSDLTAAEEDFTRACRLFQLKKNKYAEPEARLWLGEAQLSLNKDVEAADNLGLGIAAAEGGWLAYSTDIVFKELTKAETSPDREQALRMLEACRKHFALLRQKNVISRPYLVAMLARTRISEGNLYLKDDGTEARRRYGLARSAYDVAIGERPQATSEDVQLLVGRSILFLSIEDLKKEDLAKDGSRAILDAETAAELAKSGGLDARLRGEANFQAGLCYFEKASLAKKDDTWTNALKYFREALRVDASNPQAWNWRNKAGTACIWIRVDPRTNAQERTKLEQEAKRYFTDVIKDTNAPTDAQNFAEKGLETLSQ